jgi:hypothetical protein
MVGLFAVLCGIAAIWSGIRYHFVYRSIVDSFPPQFQGEPTSHYAFPVLALNPSTPLSLRAEYVKASWGGCVAFLCVSLCFFSIGEVIVGCLGLIVFIVYVFRAIRD